MYFTVRGHGGLNSTFEYYANYRLLNTNNIYRPLCFISHGMNLEYRGVWLV